MKQCCHRNILALYEVIDDEEHDEIYLVTQYAQRGVLSKVDAAGDADHKLAAAELASIGRQLCAGLAYLHRHNIAHCDIKPENILAGCDGTPLLCDFGVSRMFQDETTSLGAGGVLQRPAVGCTFAFQPPEAMLKLIDERSQRGGGDADSLTESERPALLRSGGVDAQLVAEEGDVWALGLSLYVMMCGRLPYLHHDNDPTDRLHRYAVAVTTLELEYLPTSAAGGSGGVTMAPSGGMAEDSDGVLLMGGVGKVLKCMLQRDPESRCTAKEAYEAFCALSPPPPRGTADQRSQRASGRLSNASSMSTAGRSHCGVPSLFVPVTNQDLAPFFALSASSQDPGGPEAAAAALRVVEADDSDDADSASFSCVKLLLRRQPSTSGCP